MTTKLHVNIRTLLANCEHLVEDEVNFWRLKKFIKSLDVMIEELKDNDNESNSGKISDYVKRVESIKTAINYIEIPKVSTAQKVNNGCGDDELKEMRQLETGKQYAGLRRELLDYEGNTIRNRKENISGDSDASKFYGDAQEKIAEHMLSLTRNLKEQTVTANRIIKKDTEIVSSSANMADKNTLALNKETDTLQQHSKNAYKCWMWAMIVFVIVVFIGMVLFMKIVKKKK